MQLGNLFSAGIFQSTLSVRRATGRYLQLKEKSGISIHALREESDLRTVQNWCRNERISIHALREESDGVKPRGVYEFWKFQSTLSVRRATG